MLSIEKLYAFQRIGREIKDLNRNPLNHISGFSVGLPNIDNYFEWRCLMLGAKDSCYRKGLFFLKFYSLIIILKRLQK